MTVSTDNGLVNGPVHNMQFFTLGSSKIEVLETCFFDIVTTQYDHPRYVKHVLLVGGVLRVPTEGSPPPPPAPCSRPISPSATSFTIYSGARGLWWAKFCHLQFVMAVFT